MVAENLEAPKRWGKGEREDEVGVMTVGSTR